MDTGLAMRTETAGHFSKPCSPAFLVNSCPRCRGLMVGEFCMDLLNGNGELEFLASRCVQCGEVVDPVILKNRRIQRRLPTSDASAVGNHIPHEWIH